MKEKNPFNLDVVSVRLVKDGAVGKYKSEPCLKKGGEKLTMQ